MWPAAIITGVAFVIFAGVDWSVIRQIAHSHPRDIMHLTLLVGGWIILLAHAPTGGLAVLVILKTIEDWRAHQNEHRDRAAESVTDSAVT